MERELLVNNLAKQPAPLGPKVDTIKDLAYKKEYSTNSWFVVGRFDMEGNTMDYLFHVMSMAGKRRPMITGSYLCITNETNGTFYGEPKIYMRPQCRFSDTYFEVKVPNGEMKGDLNKIVLHATSNEYEISVNLIPVGYPLYNGCTGVFPMLGMDIHQFALPSMETTGTLIHNGKTYPIQGISWLDRQWQVNDDSPVKWGWMNLSLDNGYYVSLWFPEKDGIENAWATVLHPDGTHTLSYVEPMIKDAKKYWKSNLSPWAYPTEWTVKIPEYAACLTVITTPVNQEIAVSKIPKFSHYEAASQITGTWLNKSVTGYCCVELTGEWHE